MKKLTLAIIMVLSSFSIASAELGIKVGVSAEIGTMETKGSETSSAVGADNQETKTIEALFANGGGFIEKELNFLPGPLAKLSFLSIGYSNIAHDLNLGKSSNMRLDKNVPSGAFTTTVEREHSVAGKVTDFQQIYIKHSFSTTISNETFPKQIPANKTNTFPKQYLAKQLKYLCPTQMYQNQFSTVILKHQRTYIQAMSFIF